MRVLGQWQEEVGPQPERAGRGPCSGTLVPGPHLPCSRSELCFLFTLDIILHADIILITGDGLPGRVRSVGKGTEAGQPDKFGKP